MAAVPAQPNSASRPVPPTARRAALAALAIGALVVGVAIYLLDRPAGSAMLLPASWQRGADFTRPFDTVFGGVGQWLPSFVHAFAFSLLTALAWPATRFRASAPCALWAVVDTLGEVGQHPLFAAPVALWLDAATGGAAPALALGRYLTQGSFDPADVAAGLAGAASAFLLLRRVRLG